MNFLEKTKGLMKSLWKDEAGQGLVEYGLILALVAVGLVVVLGLMKDELVTLFTDINTELAKRP
ncbi:hypothetical protein CIB95_09605 [Lottiidibacillus patelloidae]|uniref:Flp family type IVb pilin n=1 Tax=Lottiidibacillus patelloidae TaxID=2670334 RepID=A0A263BTL9_9BACI|nr:Flp family type IVb pilin [Lottiidibacillus patelloidae]OZM57015.1 hypothetical protein CIB95_09605 [Lottiidibacillus patelloidae]